MIVSYKDSVLIEELTILTNFILGININILIDKSRLFNTLNSSHLLIHHLFRRYKRREFKHFIILKYDFKPYIKNLSNITHIIV